MKELSVKFLPGDVVWRVADRRAIKDRLCIIHIYKRLGRYAMSPVIAYETEAEHAYFRARQLFATREEAEAQISQEAADATD